MEIKYLKSTARLLNRRYVNRRGILFPFIVTLFQSYYLMPVFFGSSVPTLIFWNQIFFNNDAMYISTKIFSHYLVLGSWFENYITAQTPDCLNPPQHCWSTCDTLLRLSGNAGVNRSSDLVLVSAFVVSFAFSSCFSWFMVWNLA